MSDTNFVSYRVDRGYSLYGDEMKNYWLKKNTDKACKRKWTRIEILSQVGDWYFDDGSIDLGSWQAPWQDSLKPFDFDSTEPYRGDLNWHSFDSGITNNLK